MIGCAISKNGVMVRLPEERWFHITEAHNYLSGLSDFVLSVVEDPDEIIEGDFGEMIAIKRFNNKHIAVFYREVNDKDGFVITAFVTSQIKRVEKDRKVIWKKK